MKNVFIFIVLFIMCSGMIGCSSTNIQQTIPNNTYKELVIKELSYDKKTQTISFLTENASDKKITTSLHYKIEKYNEQKQWEKTNLTDNLAFIEIVLLIEPNESIEESIDLSMIENIPNGIYRISKNYHNGNQNIVQYIQFEYVDKNLINLNTYN